LAETITPPDRQGQKGQAMAYNILIVDDSFPMRAVIKKVIKASGFDIGELLEAGNGKEALQVMDQQWLDLVLTDYNMPDMNGLELLKAMKASDTLADIPVVMVTTEGSDLRVEEFRSQGAVAYIKKPFTPEQIKSHLNQILGEPEDGQARPDASDEGLDF
jgi:two-component system chemotaxis response regulator CheY